MDNKLYKFLDQCPIRNIKFYIYSKLTQKKLFNAYDAYGKNSKADLEFNDILTLYDNTFLGSAKEGFLISSAGLHFSTWNGFFVPYAKIDRISYMDRYLLINGVQHIELTFFNETEMAQLVNLIQGIMEIVTGTIQKDDESSVAVTKNDNTSIVFSEKINNEETKCTNLKYLPKRIYYTHYY